jgi:hypothetical protein
MGVLESTVPTVELVNSSLHVVCNTEVRKNDVRSLD